MATTTAVEAQRLMTVSLKKIVESRSRRGGVNLHRNLLIAGVLFKARDAMLAEQTKFVSPVTCMLPATETVAESEPADSTSYQPMEEDEDSTVSVVPDIAAEQQSLPTAVDDSASMDWSSVEATSSTDSKENIPPPNSLTVAAVPSPCADVAVRGVKRQNCVAADEDESSCPSSKSPRHDESDHCVPEIQCAVSSSSVDCKSRSNKSGEIDEHRKSRTSKKRDQKKLASIAYQPIVCLPRIDVRSSTSGWNSLVRPIFIAQVV